MNRKLIRTTLAEVKGRGDSPSHRERGGESSGRERAPMRGGSSASRDSSGSSLIPQGRKRIPPAETNAEIFYYKKQMDAHTLMVIVLIDDSEIEGTIEWYDRAALKINRRGEPNIMLLKHNIKYMYKAEDRDGGGDEDDNDGS